MVSDPVSFLANIALIARADGTLSASELGQLEAIRKGCGFKKGDSSAAVRLAERRKPQTHARRDFCGPSEES